MHKARPGARPLQALRRQTAPKSRSVKNVTSGGSLVEDRLIDLIRLKAVVLGHILPAFPCVEPLDDGRGAHSLPGDVQPAEGNLRVDDHDFGAVEATNRDWEKADRQAFDIPIDALQMRLEDSLRTIWPARPRSISSSKRSKKTVPAATRNSSLSKSLLMRNWLSA